MELKKEKSCGCIIINKDKVLLIKHNKGHWDFPKGHVEKGETEIQTAKREVKEETNLDVEIDEKSRYVVQYITDLNTDKQVVYFLAKNTSSNIIPQEAEVQEIKWVLLEDAENIITYDTSKKLIRKVIEDLKK